jgi:TatA/E family protein of Tat protein translocase
MFGMGMPEILLILAIALIVIGPKKLPDLAKSLGRAMIEFKRATSELKSSLEVDADVMDVKKTFKDMDESFKKPIDTTTPPPTPEPAAPADAPRPADEASTEEIARKKSTEGLETGPAAPETDPDGAGAAAVNLEPERAPRDDA